MYILKQYSNRPDADYIIAGVVDSDTNKLLGFTVAYRNLERYTDKNFMTAESAMKWADSNFKVLDDAKI